MTDSDWLTLFQAALAWASEHSHDGGRTDEQPLRWLELVNAHCSALGVSLVRWSTGNTHTNALSAQTIGVSVASDDAPSLRQAFDRLRRSELAPDQLFTVSLPLAGQHVVLAPIHNGQQLTHVLQVLLAAGSPQNHIRCLQTLKLLTAAISNAMACQRRGDAMGSDTALELENVSDVCFHESQRLRPTAFAVTNELRRVMHCDRVTLLLRRGKQFCVMATSGQSEIDPRANVVRALESLTSVAMQTRQQLQYPPTAEDDVAYSPQIEKVLEEYVETSNAKSLVVRPMIHRVPTPEGGSEMSKPPFGALVFEKYRGTMAMPTGHRTDSFLRDADAATYNALVLERIPWWPAWQLLGKLRVGRRLPNLLIATFALCAAGIALAFIPADLYVTADGSLQPIETANIFVRLDGIVDDIFVEHGQHVKAGELLLTLKNVELAKNQEEVLGQLQTAQQRLRSIRSMRLRGTTRHESDSDASDHDRMSSEQQELELRIANLEQQSALLNEQRELLHVQSPLRGQVLTWDVRRQLAARPVSRGQLLMTVADSAGAWRLELKVPDNQMGHVLTAQQASAEPLPVVFVLGTAPELRHRGKLERIARAAQADPDLGTMVEATATFDELQLGDLRPGADVRAKIRCGRAALGYVWFRDVLAFVQSRVVFYFR